MAFRCDAYIETREGRKRLEREREQEKTGMIDI